MAKASDIPVAEQVTLTLGVTSLKAMQLAVEAAAKIVIASERPVSAVIPDVNSKPDSIAP
jgi:hypothetical protein